MAGSRNDGVVEKADVVIVGAGPAGLATAVSFIKLDCYSKVDNAGLRSITDGALSCRPWADNPTCQLCHILSPFLLYIFWVTLLTDIFS